MPRINSFTRRHRAGITCLVLLAASLILMLFSGRNVVMRPKEIGQSFFSAFQISIHRISQWFTDSWNSIGELKVLREELQETRRSLAEYERAAWDLIQLRQENEQLREQLDFAQAMAYRQIPAEVVAKDPGNLFSTLVIGKGSAHGVRRGMPVVAFQKGLQGLVGKVMQVGVASSTVLPIFDPSSFVAARLQNSRYDGLVSGKRSGLGRLVMQYVKKLAMSEVQYGELVITSGMGQVFPKGIHIGRVREMEARAYETSMELEIEPIVDFSRLEYVFVLDVESASESGE
jgi:rod shape-determining protein MreC